MLQALICFRTCGHTAAWASLYFWANSGLSLTIWPNRRPGFFVRVDGAGCAAVGLRGPSLVADVLDHISPVLVAGLDKGATSAALLLC